MFLGALILIMAHFLAMVALDVVLLLGPALKSLVTILATPIASALELATGRQGAFFIVIVAIWVVV